MTEEQEDEFLVAWARGLPVHSWRPRWTGAGPAMCLVVWRLDRLGRSLRDLVDQVAGLSEAWGGATVVDPSRSTRPPRGVGYSCLFAALAEFERELIRERTLAGLAAGVARGRTPGRRTVMTPEKVEAARRLLADPSVSTSAATSALGVSRATLYRHLAADEAATPWESR